MADTTNSKDSTPSAADTATEKTVNSAISNIEKQIQGELSSVQDILTSMPGETGKMGGEVSAATLGRMMGLATVSDLKLFDSKLDLLASRVSNVTTRLEKVLGILQRVPTGSDLERIDVQIGALRSLIRETMSNVAGEALSAKSGGEAAATKKPASSGIKIMTNTASDGDANG